MPNDAPPGSGPGLAEVLSHFDIYDPATPGRLNAVAHEAHQRCPVARSDAHGGYYLVAGYDEAAAVLGDPQRFSSACPKSIPGVQTLGMPPIDSDPPEQREYRQLLNRFFSKAGLAAIACIVHHLTVNPGLEDRLRATDWTRTGLDEFLRHDSVVTALARTVTVDTELGGQPLKAGDRLLVHYYAANHDPRKFESPDALDFGRGRNPHLAFGLGVHRCIGSNLARLQIRVALDELLSRVRNIRLADDSVQAQFVAGVSRHPVTLPVLFDPS
jgi:cytochrome P450